MNALQALYLHIPELPSLPGIKSFQDIPALTQIINGFSGLLRTSSRFLRLPTCQSSTPKNRLNRVYLRKERKTKKLCPRREEAGMIRIEMLYRIYSSPPVAFSPPVYSCSNNGFAGPPHLSIHPTPCVSGTLYGSVQNGNVGVLLF